MSAGKLADLVTFERRGSGDDGYGNTETGDWAPIDVDGEPLTVWADMLERTGKEKLAGGAIDALRMATIRVPLLDPLDTVTEADRVEARGVYWNIRSIVQIGRDRAELEFEVETGVAI